MLGAVPHRQYHSSANKNIGVVYRAQKWFWTIVAFSLFLQVQTLGLSSNRQYSTQWHGSSRRMFSLQNPLHAWASHRALGLCWSRFSSWSSAVMPEYLSRAYLNIYTTESDFRIATVKYSYWVLPSIACETENPPLRLHSKVDKFKLRMGSRTKLLTMWKRCKRRKTCRKGVSSVEKKELSTAGDCAQ